MPLTVNSLNLIEFVLGTKHVEIIFDGVQIAKRMCLKGGHLSTMSLCTLTI